MLDKNKIWLSFTTLAYIVDFLFIHKLLSFEILSWVLQLTVVQCCASEYCHVKQEPHDELWSRISRTFSFKMEFDVDRFYILYRLRHKCNK
jgi:hypothetical protein